MNEPTVEDMAAMRADGSLCDYFQFLIGRPPATEPAQQVPDEEGRSHHTRSVGAWPCGSASTGPTPMTSPCPDCQPAQELRPAA